MRLKRIKKFLKDNWILGLLVLISFSLNVIGADFGLPRLWHPDELTHGVGKMLSEKSLNPGRFTYPSLYHYILIAANVPFSAYLLISGKAALIATDQALKEAVLTNLFLTARVVTAAFGAGIAILTYLIALKVSDKRSAIISACFSSLSMAIVTYSHFASSDIPVTFFSLIAIYAILGMFDRPKTLNYIIAGAAIGLATGTKYYAGLLVLLLYAAHLMKKKPIIDKNLILSGFSCIVAFLISTPFAVLDFPTFYRDTTALLVQTQLGVQNLYDPVTGLSYLFHLDNGLGTPLLFLCLAGMVYTATLMKKDKRILLLMLWTIVYFALISYRIHFSFLRYILPIIPFMLIFAGIFSSYLIKRYKSAAVAILAIIIIFNLAYAIKTDHLFLNDSRYRSTDWINENLKGSRIMAFADNLRYYPDIGNESLILLDIKEYGNVEAIKEAIDEISPDFIITSSLYHNRFLYYTNMYPRRSPLQKIFGYDSNDPVRTEFYTELLDGRLGYELYKKFPEEKSDVPDPEFIDPEIFIFKNS